MLFPSFEYVNFDDEEGRKTIKEKSWDRKRSVIIFDEIHKMPKWKQWLKGIYDTEGVKPPIVVTGSARLDAYKKVGDSLAGRYFHYRLHPLDVRELTKINYQLSPQEIIDRLMSVGGFPEPFLEGSKTFYLLWKKTHLDIILRQDLIDLEVVKNIKQIEHLSV
jgi:predicted AAA+ superfamily ATPase